MKKMFDIETVDGAIPNRIRDEVWSYIENQPWHVTWKKLPAFERQDYEYIPAKEPAWRHLDPARLIPHMYMPRALFASDDASLEKNHPPLWNLWKQINSVFDDQFVIEGDPEGIATDIFDDPKYKSPETRDPSLEQGWRVYANNQPHETIKRSHGVHRDVADVNKEGFYTLLYFANLEWYPSWFAENIFYPNDVNNTIGDHQQFQGALGWNQDRNFSIGWGDEGKIVSPKPGRILLYDGRCLHTTRPAASWARTTGRKAIVFRIRKKST